MCRLSLCLALAAVASVAVHCAPRAKSGGGGKKAATGTAQAAGGADDVKRGNVGPKEKHGNMPKRGNMADPGAEAMAALCEQIKCDFENGDLCNYLTAGPAPDGFPDDEAITDELYPDVDPCQCPRGTGPLPDGYEVELPEPLPPRPQTDSGNIQSLFVGGATPRPDAAEAVSGGEELDAACPSCVPLELLADLPTPPTPAPTPPPPTPAEPAPNQVKWLHADTAFMEGEEYEIAEPAEGTGFAAASVQGGEMAILELPLPADAPKELAVYFWAYERQETVELRMCCGTPDKCPWRSKAAALSDSAARSGETKWEEAAGRCPIGTDKILFVCESWRQVEGVCAVDDIFLRDVNC